jgi:hydroxyacylglutathione hydrolase
MDNISDYVKSLTTKEVFVILTHGHLDHASGAGLFEDVYMNLKDKDVYQQHTNIEYRYNYFSNIPELKDISIERYNKPLDFSKIKALKDKQRFDLGGVHLKLIEVPGHTPGMTCILVEEERVILFGDACGNFVLLFEEYSSCVSEYRNNLLALKKVEMEYDGIIRNHGTGESSKELLDNVIECCELILNKQDDRVPFRFAEVDLILAKKIDQHHNRIDGKFGNIAYRLDKSK